METILELAAFLTEQVAKVGLATLAAIGRHRPAFVSILLAAVAAFGAVAALAFARRERVRALAAVLWAGASLLLWLQLRLPPALPPAIPPDAQRLLRLGYAATLVVAALVSWSLLRTGARVSDLFAGRSGPPEPERPRAARLRRIAGLAALLFLACVPVRLWELSAYPKFFGAEFAGSAKRAFEVIESGGTAGLLTALDPASGRYLQVLNPHIHWLGDVWALVFVLFGSGIAQMKIVPTVFGLAGVALLWPLGERWLGRHAGLAAAFLAALSPYLIGVSRDVWASVGLVFPFTLVLLHLLLRSLERPRVGNLAAVGVLAGVCMHQYQPAYVLLPVVALSWGAKFLADSGWRRRAWPGLVLGTLLALVVMWPLLYLQFSDQFWGSFTFHLRDTSAVAKGEPFAARLCRNAAELWRQVAYDGMPMAFGAGVQDFNTYTSLYHLPVTVALFFVGLGLTLGTVHRSREARILLLLLLLGLLPALLALEVRPRRLIASEPVFFLLAGRGLAELGRAGLAILGRRLAPLAAGPGVVGLLLLACVGWGTYVDLARNAEPDYHRELSEEVARAIEQETVVMLLTGMDIHRTRNVVYVLAWNRFPRAEVDRRLLYVEQPAWVDRVILAPNLGRVRFVFRADQVAEDRLREAFARYAASHPDWELFAPEPGARAPWQRYPWLRAPREDIEAALALVREVHGLAEPP